jgi:hypothetical protein
MLLKRFATEQRKLVMVDRQPPHAPRPSSVKNACAECGFYSIPAEELEESSRDGHDPEAVEHLLATLEGDTDPLIAGLIAGHFPPSPVERFSIAVFTAVQMTRGWRWRQDMEAVGNIITREQASLVPRNAIRDWLRGQGDRHDATAVRAFRERMFRADNSVEVRMTQAYAVQESLRMAVGDLAPRLFARPLRLLRFDDNVLLTSDNPVGIWAPAPGGVSPAIGRGDAPMIFLPLDRRTALAFATNGSDRVSHPGPIRARQINLSLIEDARRWIFHHPDDQPLQGITIPPLTELVQEVVAVREGSDGMTHELHRIAKRRVSPEGGYLDMDFETP